MGVHNNIHVPKESWPAFLWYALEFFIVLAVGLVISYNSMDFFKKIGMDSSMSTWIFWGIVGIGYAIYYMIIRPLILKRPALSKV